MTDIDGSTVTLIHTVETEDSPSNMKRGACTKAPCGSHNGFEEPRKDEASPKRGRQTAATSFLSNANTYRWDNRKSCGAFAKCVKVGETVSVFVPMGQSDAGAMGSGGLGLLQGERRDARRQGVQRCPHQEPVRRGPHRHRGRLHCRQSHCVVHRLAPAD